MSLSIAKERYEEILALLAETEFSGATLEPLAGDASFRRYIRIYKGKKSAMLMDAPVDKEDVRPYLMIARHLYKKGYSAPDIIAQKPESGLLLLEDLGNDSFSHCLHEDPNQQETLYKSAIELLAQWHDPAKNFASSDQLPVATYDNHMLAREVELFSQWYLPQALGTEKAAQLSEEYLALWKKLLKENPLDTNVWVHRDYHADNLMWVPARDGLKRIGLLDFQDGVYGDAAYDLVSLLEDARRDVPEELAESMLKHYMAVTGCDEQKLRLHYALLGAQRNSKIIGIFTRLAVRDHKPHYLAFLPRVWGYLQKDLQHPVLEPLRTWLDEHVDAQHRGVIAIPEQKERVASS